MQSSTPEIAYSYFKVNGKLLKLEHQNILLVQSIKGYAIVKTTHGNYITHMTMKAVSELLPHTMFRRIHRSYTVGIAHLTMIGKNEVHVGKECIPVGESYKQGLASII